MFIVLNREMLCAPAERNVLCQSKFHPAPDAAAIQGALGYKHFAPLEQTNDMTFCAKQHLKPNSVVFTFRSQAQRRSQSHQPPLPAIAN